MEQFGPFLHVEGCLVSLCEALVLFSDSLSHSSESPRQMARDCRFVWWAQPILLESFAPSLVFLAHPDSRIYTVISVSEMALSLRLCSSIRTEPFSVNLMALLAKLIRICVSERWSVLIRKSPSGADTSNFKFLPSASVRSVVLTSSMMDRQFKASRFSSTLPDSILARSNESLMRDYLRRGTKAPPSWEGELNCYRGDRSKKVARGGKNPIAERFLVDTLKTRPMQAFPAFVVE